jgi:hypothetical protein
MRDAARAVIIVSAAPPARTPTAVDTANFNKRRRIHVSVSFGFR